MFSESISNEDLALCKAKGWRAFCIFDLDIDEFKEAFQMAIIYPKIREKISASYAEQKVYEALCGLSNDFIG